MSRLQTRSFQTDLSCESCVQTMKPILDADPSLKSWSIDVKDDLKPITVTGEPVDEQKLRALFKQGGYKIIRELNAIPVAVKPGALKTYYPLILILGYLLLSLAVLKPANPMAAFMGGFFLIFSFFKFLNLKGFADAYQTYDLLAAYWRPYAFVYPFIELALGLALIAGFAPFAVNLTTFILMLLSSIGVVQSLLTKKVIQCACLGTVFKLPMTKVTLFEDLLMAGMALYALITMGMAA